MVIARSLRRAGAGFAILLLAAGAACRRSPPPPSPLVPDASGSRQIPGLSAPVRVIRDRWGIPHIYAASQNDLFVAQGFVQAQDRLFQMDLWRRSALGRLSQVLGPNFAERDAMTRRIQFAGDPASDWNSYAPDARAIAAAFVRGVNAWVVLARERPPEEFVLAGWSPEFWRPDDLLNRTDAFAAGGDAIEEIARARLVAAIGARRAAELLPELRGVALPAGLDFAVAGSAVADAVRSVGAPPFFLGLATKFLTTPSADSPEPGARRGDVPLDVRTLPAPSSHYLVHLHAPSWNVIGATAPWLPGVADGHNDRVWWTSEPADVDTQDVFVERVNPADPHQVDEGGRWVATELTKDPLVILRRDKPLVFDRERTRHGAILAVDRERHLAFAVRSVAQEPGAASALLALDIDRAPDAGALRAALARWKAPARRVTYADLGGERGSALAALAPIRRGWNGAVPAPGWTGANDWIGWRWPDAVETPSPLRLLARRHPDRADALLRRLRDAADSADAPTAMRALLVNAVADALRDDGGSDGVLFAHPLAITDATRRRFNIGPVRPDSPNAPVFVLRADAADWDHATAMNAPGQSGWAASPHYRDLARRWKEGSAIPLAFSDAAVAAAAESTLLLSPAPGSAAR